MNRRLGCLLSVLALGALSVSFEARAQVQETAPEPEGDPRSIERLRYQCRNELGRRDITLFGNGTLRVREGLFESERMDLAELAPEDLRQALADLALEDPTDGIDSVAWSGDVGGPFVEQCSMRVQLPGRNAITYSFARHDVLPLRIQRWIGLAERWAEQAKPSRPGLPKDYDPSFGDILVDDLDQRYRVQFRTPDGAGIELVGLEQPVRMIIPISALGERFVRVESSTKRP